jgi:ribosomal-protein-alanine N-acetyltransferase
MSPVKSDMVASLRDGGGEEAGIRPAWAGDLDQIVAVERASFSDPWHRQSFAHLLEDSRVYFRVACLSSGEVAGYVIAWFAADEGEVANIAVAPGARGRGIGAAMLDAVMEAALGRGVGSLYLDVRESNLTARRLYASRGFAEIGRRRGYYRRPSEDALVLRCRLDGHRAGPGGV